jgi:glucose/arabinose dehydrogenase
LLRRTVCVRSPSPRAGFGKSGWRRARGSGHRLWLGVWAAGSLALSVSCEGNPSESPPPESAVSLGQLELGLSAQLDGVTYRLSAVFDVTGAESVVLDTSDAPEAIVLTSELPAGGYVVALRPDFVVSRADGDVLEPLVARLLSDAVQAVQVTANESSRVTYRFALPGGDVTFGSGTLEIGFEVGTSGADCRPPEGAPPALGLVEVAGGLAQPVLVAAAPGDDSRLFVLEKAGRIRVLIDGVLAPEPFADLTGQIASQGERGLLGLAFHPDYAINGLAYVHFSSNGTDGVALGSGVIAELPTDAFDRDRADVGALRRLLTIAKPEANHNGGMLAFGPNDGYLYVATGDGGGSCNDSPRGAPQDINSLLGKILRLDVSTPGVAGVPDGNPFGNLVWAYGLRNPWRFSFDRGNGDLYIGDVGQNAWEEIDHQPAASGGGENYGWPYLEANACSDRASGCDEWECGNQPESIAPVHAYNRGDGIAVTGGYVYRGRALPDVQGTYFFADYGSASVWGFEIANVQGTFDTWDLGFFTSVSSFGEDGCGELYVVDYFDGTIYRIVHR